MVLKKLLCYPDRRSSEKLNATEFPGRCSSSGYSPNGQILPFFQENIEISCFPCKSKFYKVCEPNRGSIPAERLKIGQKLVVNINRYFTLDLVKKMQYTFFRRFFCLTGMVRDRKKERDLFSTSVSVLPAFLLLNKNLGI
jgi:hypothetical protein